MINRITFTGPDDATNPNELHDIAGAYPAVEWGILVSKSKVGEPRYPTLEWQNKLVSSLGPFDYKLSMHVCGAWCRDIVSGKDGAWQELPPLVNECDRLQLNFNNPKLHINDEGFIRNLKNLPVRQIIIPYNKATKRLITLARSRGINVAPLFDSSGGLGMLPNSWPQKLDGFYCGYAGGLGPDNIGEQIKGILSAVGDELAWIDMETRVRTNEVLDLDKVLSVIRTVEPYIRNINE